MIRVRLNDSKKFKLSIGNRVLKNELDENAKIPVISANVNEVFGKTNKEIITDYSVPYIIWGIDGDWMVKYMEKGIKFYPTDHCGYIKVLDKNINPIYLTKVLKMEGDKQRFSRSNRASIDRVSSIVVTLPNIKVQNSIVNKISGLENKINNLKNNLDRYQNKKIKIVNKYLN